MMMKRKMRLPSSVALFAAVLLAVATTGACGHGATSHPDTMTRDVALHGNTSVTALKTQVAMS